MKKTIKLTEEEKRKLLAKIRENEEQSGEEDSDDLLEAEEKALQSRVKKLKKTPKL